MVMKLEFHCSLQNTSILVALDSKGLVILNVTNFCLPHATLRVCIHSPGTCPILNQCTAALKGPFSSQVSSIPGQ